MNWHELSFSLKIYVLNRILMIECIEEEWREDDSWKDLYEFIVLIYRIMSILFQ